MKPEYFHAWLAGFIDGEGYIGISKQYKAIGQHNSPTPLYKPWIIISNNVFEIVLLIQVQLGMGRIIVRKSSGNRTDSYQLKINKLHELQSVLGLIRPYLKVKDSQADILKDFILHRQSITITTGRGSRGKTSYNEIDEDLYRKLRDLNKRGI